MEIPIKIKKLTSEAKTPTYAHPGDAGLDIFSNEETIINPLKRKLISTGISMSIPENYVAFIKDKSGIAYKKGLTHMAGVIDSSYRGEYKILLFNTTQESIKIEKHEKLAQIVFLPYSRGQIEIVENLEETSRGEEGFGSTGTK